MVAETNRRQGVRWTVFLLVLAPLAILAGWAWHRHGGWPSLLAHGLGLVYGGFVVAVGRWFVRRQSTSRPIDLVREVMLGSVVSILLFLFGIVGLASSWRAGLVPATLSALVLYLACRFYEVLTLSVPPTTAPEAGGTDDTER